METTCCRCFLPIHRDDARVYLGDRCAHNVGQCTELLRMELAAKDARIAELAKMLADCGDEIRRAERERDEARRVAVWAVRRGALIVTDKLTWVRSIDEADDDEYRVGQVSVDPTDDGSLYAALRDAKGE